jgi:hypothetical protein
MKTPEELAINNKGEMDMNEIIINGEVYRKTQPSMSSYVIIRTYSAGVHFGIIERREGKEVELRDARRIWYWEGAASLSQMAVNGVSKPKSCKFSVITPVIILTEAIEIIPCTEQAAKCILEVPVWTA